MVPLGMFLGKRSKAKASNEVEGKGNERSREGRSTDGRVCMLCRYEAEENHIGADYSLRTYVFDVISCLTYCRSANVIPTHVEHSWETQPQSGRRNIS